MPITMQFEAVNWDVVDARAPDGSGAKALILEDSVSGIRVVVPLLDDVAKRMGGRLRGTGLVEASRLPTMPPADAA